MTMARDSQVVLLLDDDGMITEALGMGLEREGRTVITCNDIESAELIVGRLRPSHIITDMRLTGPFAFEGLDFIRFIKRHTPDSRIILITGDALATVQSEASDRGASAFLQKPFDIAELEAALDAQPPPNAPAATGLGPLVRVPTLDSILAGDTLRPHFQPIVTLDGSRSVVGYESLARLRSESPMRNPALLFEYADRKRRVGDLELACMSLTLEVGAAIASTVDLFINVHPAVLAMGTALRDRLVAATRAANFGLDRIVLEITEQASLNGRPGALDAIAELRQLGLRFAFDDFGAAYSHLPLIGAVKPTFLKISQDFGTDFESDPTRTKIILNILSLARDFDCTLILEGIERESTARAAADLGIPLGQGYLFGRPEDAAVYLERSRR